MIPHPHAQDDIPTALQTIDRDGGDRTPQARPIETTVDAFAVQQKFSDATLNVVGVVDVDAPSAAKERRLRGQMLPVGRDARVDDQCCRSGRKPTMPSWTLRRAVAMLPVRKVSPLAPSRPISSFQ